MSEKIEERLAHLEKLADELSDIVAEQSREIAALKARASFLMEREAEREADADGGVVFGDEKPPHY